MSLFRRNGFVDNIKDKRIGLLFLKIGYDTSTKPSITIITPNNGNYGNYNVIIEVKEVYCDKLLSKIKVISTPFNKSDYSKGRILESKYFPVWTENKNIYWLSPPTDVDRDNKLKEILK